MRSSAPTPPQSHLLLPLLLPQWKRLTMSWMRIRCAVCFVQLSVFSLICSQQLKKLFIFKLLMDLSFVWLYSPVVLSLICDQERERDRPGVRSQSLITTQVGWPGCGWRSNFNLKENVFVIFILEREISLFRP